ncbi:hypothetical protein CLOM_g10942 [Closterium sp. NIES-68]|nr:hypothetical protein CLOM_g10942 [Closterium sp. NIES-68]GJP57808.1 hypothetical protein CLOP_g17399 [Closterium sp. NIES-67]
MSRRSLCHPSPTIAPVHRFRSAIRVASHASQSLSPPPTTPPHPPTPLLQTLAGSFFLLAQLATWLIQGPSPR